MPIKPSKAVDSRTKIHTRTIECNGYEREDGLWDIEGFLRDDKHYSFQNDWRGHIEPGDPLHDMGLRITVDDALNIIDSEAFIDKSPYPVCPAIAINFKRLIGLQIAPGFTKKVKVALGGVRGCTHLVDLVGPLATTAFQTIIPALAKRKGMPLMPSIEDGDKNKRPALINTCHALSASGDVVKNRWPEWYEEPEE